MDQQRAPVETILQWTRQPRARGFAIATVALTLLVILQVQRREPAPVCELFTGCQLQSDEIQRIQIAFNQNGLSAYQIKNNSIYVPSDQLGQYVKVATDSNVLPADLRQVAIDETTSNPFLSRRQQLAIELNRKKQQVREMVVRLPFVDQAWFEMDKSESGNAFRPARQSAVVEIRTPSQVTLTDRHVETVKQMISGAIADLDHHDIVVINLKDGMTYQQSTDPETQQQLQVQRIAFDQQRHFESRIKQVLTDYPEVHVRVLVDVRPVDLVVRDQVAQAALPTLPQPSSSLPQAGANGVVSIAPEVTSERSEGLNRSTLIRQASQSSPVSSVEYEKQISVMIDVPESLVHRISATGTMDLAKPRTPEHAQAQLKAGFDRVRERIVGLVVPLLPGQSANMTDHRVSVQLQRDPIVATDPSSGWSQARELAEENWPSAAVLVIGLGLMIMVTRQSQVPTSTASVQENQDHDVLSINAAADPSGDVERQVETRTEERLTKLIEDDPDAAARVIESWIRDAA